MEEFSAAAQSCLQAHARQMEGVARGHAVGLETEIRAATRRRDQAKQAILRHQTEHGC